MRKKITLIGAGQIGGTLAHLIALKEANTKIFVSGKSAKARGYDETLLEGYNAEFAMPDKLIDESLHSDSVLCY